MFIDQIREYLKDLAPQGLSREYTVNLLRELLQYYVLSIIYNSNYKDVTFTGGTCLRICYGLDRLSEDIDIDCQTAIDAQKFAGYIVAQFNKMGFMNIEFSVKGQGRSIYLKFSLLKKLGLAAESQSDKLYAKVDLSINPAPTFDTDLYAINRFDLSFLARHYDLPSLFAGKLHAVFTRSFFRGKGDLINIKGRDFYDLLWLLNKKAVPNLKRLNEMLCVDSDLMFGDLNELRSALLERVDAINPHFIYDDVRFFFKDAAYITGVTKNYHSLIVKLLKDAWVDI